MYEDNFVATGLGAHMALPLMRKAWKEDMTEDEARKLLVDCMRVLFYRDTRASAKITIGKVRDHFGCSRACWLRTRSSPLRRSSCPQALLLPADGRRAWEMCLALRNVLRNECA